MRLLRRQDSPGSTAQKTGLPTRRAFSLATMNMKSTFRIATRCVVLCTALALLASCSRPLRLQVVLEKSEDITKGMPVNVDSAKAGTVVAVGEEGGERVANLAITLKEARDRLRVGALRVPESGRIQINTDAVKDGAALLPHGARIPTTSKVGYFVAKYSRTSTLAAVGIAVVVLVIVWLVFRSLVGTIGLILCVVFAGVLTQVIQPYAVPWVEKVLNHIGPPPAPSAAPSTPEPPKPSAPVPSAAKGPLPSAAQVYKQAESTVIEVMNSRPSPVVVTWCAVFVLSFIGFNLVLGRVSRVWRK
jgi:hypothetical protein